MEQITKLKERILNGYSISKEEAMTLVEVQLEPLTQAANEIRNHFCGNAFDICTIINAKSGKCPENCRYCAQSAYYETNVDIYPLKDKEHIVSQARYNDEQGVLRYSLVTILKMYVQHIPMKIRKIQ